MRGAYVKSFLTTSVTCASGTVYGTSPMNVPLMAAGIMPRGQAAGIQIWSIDVEFDRTGWAKVVTTDAQYLKVYLSAVPITAEKFVNDRDVLWSFEVYHKANAAGEVCNDLKIISKDFYPAIPFYGQQIHFGVQSGLATTAVTVYCKVWYSLVTMTQNEILAQLQNQLT